MNAAAANGNGFELTLEELAAEVGRELAARGLAEPQPDGRVSAVPDPRTIRYYGTLGLLDRPRVEGRQARYGRRHLWQLLAIKALQASQLPLAEVQAQLYGRSERELEAIVEAAAAEAARAGATPPRPVTWREVAIAPGLKVLAGDSFSPGSDPEVLVQRFRAALAALARGDRANGEGEGVNR